MKLGYVSPNYLIHRSRTLFYNLRAIGFFLLTH